MLAVIGGTGFNQFEYLSQQDIHRIQTPYGDATVAIGQWHGQAVAFLARHGSKHHLAPHQVPYRANVYALHHLGVKAVLAFQAVGGIHTHLKHGDIVLPTQLIDYTNGRESSFFDGHHFHLEQHIDFTHPFHPVLHEAMIDSFDLAGIDIHKNGVYGVTQGPRLETAAEIVKLSQDTCTIVGMTAMPEAILARELEMAYISISLVANMAAGIEPSPITIEEIQHYYSLAKTRALEGVSFFLRHKMDILKL